MDQLRIPGGSTRAHLLLLMLCPGAQDLGVSVSCREDYAENSAHGPSGCPLRPQLRAGLPLILPCHPDWAQLRPESSTEEGGGSFTQCSTQWRPQGTQLRDVEGHSCLCQGPLHVVSMHAMHLVLTAEEVIERGGLPWRRTAVEKGRPPWRMEDSV